jgi:hypothetical protein
VREEFGTSQVGTTAAPALGVGAGFEVAQAITTTIKDGSNADSPEPGHVPALPHRGLNHIADQVSSMETMRAGSSPYSWRIPARMSRLRSVPSFFAFG